MNIEIKRNNDINVRILINLVICKCLLSNNCEIMIVREQAV